MLFHLILTKIPVSEKLLFPFYPWGNWDLWKSNNSPKVTERLSGRAMIQTQDFWRQMWWAFQSTLPYNTRSGTPYALISCLLSWITCGFYYSCPVLPFFSIDNKEYVMG